MPDVSGQKSANESGTSKWEDVGMRPATLALIPRIVWIAFGLLTLASVSAPIASADTPVIPPSAGLPWTDPNHRGPLEMLASQIASRIAGRSDSVRCESDNDWSTLTMQRGNSDAAGYVEVPPLDSVTRRFVADSTIAELSPTVCYSLQQFAIAETKPTKCQPLVSQSVTTYVETRYQVTVTERHQVTVRIKKNGKWTTRKVWRTREKLVWRTHQDPVTVDQQVPGPWTPCYLGNQHSAWNEPDDYWAAYRSYAFAVLVLAHESIHLAENRAGVLYDAVKPTSETHANCYGLQWIPYTAGTLGATPDDAHAIASYAFDYVYPGFQGVTGHDSPYWSVDCHENGPLDLTPNDGVWP
jgi:hypothetical protein